MLCGLQVSHSAFSLSPESGVERTRESIPIVLREWNHPVYFDIDVYEPGFMPDGLSRMNFDRVANSLSLDGKTQNGFSFIQHSEVLLDVEKTIQNITTGNENVPYLIIPTLNVCFNEYYAVLKRNKTDNSLATFTYSDYLFNGQYHPFLIQKMTPTGPTVTEMKLRFEKSNTGNRHRIFDDQEREVSVRSEITAGFYGPFLVSHNRFDPMEILQQLDDVRHAVRFPVIYSNKVPGNQMILGVSDGVGTLYKHTNLLYSAYCGDPVTLSLNPAYDYGVTLSDIRESFQNFGYVENISVRSNLLPGQYTFDPHTQTVTVRYLKGLHPHTFLGIKDGKLIAGYVPGETNLKGTDLITLGFTLKRMGFSSAVAIGNGKDTRFIYPRQHNKTEGVKNSYPKTNVSIVLRPLHKDSISEINPNFMKFSA